MALLMVGEDGGWKSIVMHVQVRGGTRSALSPVGLLAGAGESALSPRLASVEHDPAPDLDLDPFHKQIENVTERVPTESFLPCVKDGGGGPVSRRRLQTQTRLALY